MMYLAGVCSLVVLLSAPIFAQVEREFFFRLEVNEVIGIPDVDGGFGSTSQCYNDGSEVLIRVEIGGRGRLAEQKSGFTEVSSDGDYNVDWSTNIINAQLGEELRVSLADYQNPDDKIPGNECTALTLQTCHATEVDCDDESSRQELCKSIFNQRSPQCNEGGIDGCDKKINDKSAIECFSSRDGCEAVRTFLTDDVTENTGTPGEPYSSLCFFTRRQPLGFARIILPDSVTIPEGVSWDPNVYGNRTNFGALQTLDLEVVQRQVNGDLDVISTSATPRTASIRVQFWASKCAVGEFITAEGYCSTCEPGFECPTGVTPEPCQAGDYNKFNGSEPEYNGCVPCENGKFARESASKECSVCQAGFECDGVSSKVCDIGTFQAEDESAEPCAACSEGFYQSGRGATECEPCPEGTKCDNGQSAIPCERGTYQPEGSYGECRKCPGGRYQSGRSAVECEPCPEGNSCLPDDPTVGATKATPCPPGAFQDGVEIAGECKKCAPGRFQTSQGQAGCEPCPEGSFCLPEVNSDVGATKATPCPPGTFQKDEEAEGECEPCEAGLYQSSRGQASCEPCPVGNECIADPSSSETGATGARLCNPGSFQAEARSGSPCSLCPLDSYQEDAGRDKCVPCEGDTFAWPEGQELCTAVVRCSNFEEEVTPRINDTQPVCVQLQGLGYTAARIGMSTGAFIGFIVGIIILAGLIVSAFLLWSWRRQQQAKKREAKLAQDKIDLQQQMQATENLALNPLMLQNQSKTQVVKNVADPEKEKLLADLQQENNELRAELKRYKIDQQHVSARLASLAISPL